MSLLNDQIEKQLRQAFEALTGPVKIVMFTRARSARVRNLRRHAPVAG